MDPRYRGSDGFRHWTGSDGFRHWEDERFGAGFHHRNVAFSGTGILFFGTDGTAADDPTLDAALPDSALGNDGYQLPPLWHEILRRGRPSRAGQSLCALDGPEAAPIIRRALYPRRFVGEPEKVRRPEFSVARTSPFRDLDKPKRHAFPNSRTDCVAINSVLVKVLISHQQLAVVLATVGASSISRRSSTRRADRLNTRNAGDSLSRSSEPQIVRQSWCVGWFAARRLRALWH